MKYITAAAIIAATTLGVSSQAMASSTLNIAVYSNIPNDDYYPNTKTIDRERAAIAAMSPTNVSQTTLSPNGFGFKLKPFEAALYTGTLNVVQSGNYTFTVYADDAARISINGRAIVEAFHYYPTAGLPYTASLYLTAGSYDYEAFTYQLTGNQWFGTSVTGGPAAVSFSAAAVPEPATWALMMVGFAMVAGASRYRRRATAIAFG